MALRMHVVGYYFRALACGLVSLGMIVPAWATQSCQCADGTCAAAARQLTTPAEPTSCCTPRPCCAANQSQLAETTVCVTGESVGCPCCVDAAPPTTPAPKQSDVSPSDHQPTAAVGVLSAAASLVTGTNYLKLNLGSPPGHPGLSLHALYRVWLN